MALALEGPAPMLEVFDLPTSIAFYRDVLGFKLVSGDDSWWCMLKLGECTLMLNTAYDPAERPPAPEPHRVRGHADLSLYFDADPDQAYAHLRSLGWNASAPAETSYGFRQTRTQDPDGFQLCFHRPIQREIAKPHSILGSIKGTFTITGDIVEPEADNQST